jgi:hypothetical protein
MFCSETFREGGRVNALFPSDTLLYLLVLQGRVTPLPYRSDIWSMSHLVECCTRVLNYDVQQRGLSSRPFAVLQLPSKLQCRYQILQISSRYPLSHLIAPEFWIAMCNKSKEDFLHVHLPFFNFSSLAPRLAGAGTHCEVIWSMSHLVGFCTKVLNCDVQQREISIIFEIMPRSINVNACGWRSGEVRE